jgi:hypothetical protein
MPSQSNSFPSCDWCRPYLESVTISPPVVVPHGVSQYCSCCHAYCNTSCVAVAVSPLLASRCAYKYVALSQTMNRRETGECSSQAITAAESNFRPRWKIFSAPPPPPPQVKADRLKIFTLNRKDWVSIVEWIGFCLKRLIFYNWQIMTVPRKKNPMQYSSPGPPSGPPSSRNLQRLFPPLSSALQEIVPLLPIHLFRNWELNHCLTELTNASRGA